MSDRPATLAATVQARYWRERARAAEARVSELESALTFVASAAGNPDAAEGCRVILRHIAALAADRTEEQAAESSLTDMRRALEDDDAIMAGVRAVREMLRMRVGDKQAHAEAFRRALAAAGPAPEEAVLASEKARAEAAEARVSELVAALEGMNTHAKQRLIDQGQGLVAYVRAALAADRTEEPRRAWYDARLGKVPIEADRTEEGAE